MASFTQVTRQGLGSRTKNSFGGAIFGFVLLAGIVWSIVVSIAWIFYRSVLAIAILVVTVVPLALLVKRLRSVKATAPGNVPASPPPAVA